MNLHITEEYFRYVTQTAQRNRRNQMADLRKCQQCKQYYGNGHTNHHKCPDCRDHLSRS